MGSNCCKCGKGAVEGSEITLADLLDQAADLREMEIEERRNDHLREMDMEVMTRIDYVTLESEPPGPVLERPPSLVSTRLKEETSITKQSPRNFVHNGLSCYKESSILWSTGSFSNMIPSGFYSVPPDDRLKLFESIPTSDELRAPSEEGLKTDLLDQAADLREMEIEDRRNDHLREMDTKVMTRNDNVTLESEPPSPVLERPASLVSTGLQEETSITKQSPRNFGHNGLSCYKESNILWSTGSFSNMIPSGFYSVIPDDRLKLFKSIPTLDELRALSEGLKTDVILVDFVKDKKLYRLRELIISLVLGLNSNPVKAIKKIGELVVDNTPLRKNTQPFESSLLGHIKHGSCRVRSILFKVLADATGYKSKLVMGCPSDLKCSASVNSYDHMSVVIILNTVEIMVDLKRSPIQLIPISNQEVSMANISDAENGSSHSPLEPNSPMHGHMDQTYHESLSRSEPNLATGSLRHIQENVIRKQRSTPNPSPLRTYVRTRERFMLNGGKKPVQEVGDDASRSVRAINEQGGDEVLGSSTLQNKSLLPNEERNIDFSELKVGTLVGVGCSAAVYRGIWNGTEVAIKMFLEQEDTVENRTDFRNEISILSRVQHPNVILFHGACTKPPQVSLITEYMEKGSLYHLIHSTEEINNLSWQEKLKMLCDICRGLMCIHKKGIVHRDLKSANCLLNNDWTVKICDFGLSKMMEGTTVNDSVPAGTPEWVAPEVIRNEPFSEKCDIFSFGVIVWELCTQSKPWQGISKEKVINVVANEGARLEIPEGPLAKLIADCWSEDPEKRPNCAQILIYLATCEDSAP